MLFREGDVQEHAELSWLLSSVTSVRELDRMHQFRDSRSTSASSSPPGCSSTPSRRPPTVFAYRADEMLVGEDQREHWS